MGSRRHFIRQAVAGMAGIGAGAGIMGSSSFGTTGTEKTVYNLVTPAAKVGVVRSGHDLASEITTGDIEKMVRGAVESAGGFGEVVGDGATVVLKVNLVSWYDESKSRLNLPLEANGVTTDYRFARAVVAMIRDHNPHGRIIILEGAANGATRTAMEWLGYDSEHIPGVDDFLYLEERSGGWEEWNSPYLVTTTPPTGTALYPDRLKPNKSPDFYLNRVYFEADTIISLPVLKNHSTSNVSGAVKNIGIGCTPQNIYGGAEGENRRYINGRISHTPQYLHQWIHDYYLCRPVDYAIMDGIQATSHGPVAGGVDKLENAQQNMRMILAGRNAVALDAAASYLMCRDPRQVRHLSLLAGHGAGPIEPAEIRMDDISVTETRKQFKLASLLDIDASYIPPEPPSLVIGDCRVKETKLHITLTTGSSTVKIEVAVNGETLPVSVTGDFSDFEVELPAGVFPKQLSVTAYDAFFGSITREVTTITSVQSQSGREGHPLELLPNSPNPFNPSTTIPFRIEKSGYVRLAVYSLTGSMVEVLESGWRRAGLYTVRFDGRKYASGTYLCRLESGDRVVTRKIQMVK